MGCGCRQNKTNKRKTNSLRRKGNKRVRKRK